MYKFRCATELACYCGSALNVLYRIYGFFVGLIESWFDCFYLKYTNFRKCFGLFKVSKRLNYNAKTHEKSEFYKRQFGSSTSISLGKSPFSVKKSIFKGIFTSI